MSILKLKDSQGNWVGVPTIKGAKGDNGNGISSTVLNNDYTLTLTFTDGTTYTTPSIRGEKGEQGEPATDMDIHICSASEYDSETRIPTITSPDDKTFYLVPTVDGTSPDLFTEWVYVNNAWEMFGSANVDLTDYVKNTDYASANTGGVVKVDIFTNDYQGGIATIDNKLNVIGSSATDIKSGLYYNKPVVAGNQHESTFYGLAKVAGHDEKDSELPVGQYTDEAKSSIQNMLGITNKYSPKDWIAESETELVANAHSVGDLFYIGETLYKVIADLNAGDAINVGVNVEEVDVNNILTDYATKEDVQDNISIVEKSASGAIASFPDGADDIPLKSLTVNIDPVQDLHGYDSPWVGGGGINLNPIESVGESDSAANRWYVAYRLPLSAGTYYTYTELLDGSNYTSGLYLSIDGGGYTRLGTNGGLPMKRSFTIENDAVITLYLSSSTIPSDVLARTAISKTDIDRWTPYENICPISGWTGCEVSATGKNLFDERNLPLAGFNLVTDPSSLDYGYYAGNAQELGIKSTSIFNRNNGGLTRKIPIGGQVTVSADMRRVDSRGWFRFYYTDGTNSGNGYQIDSGSEARHVSFASNAQKSVSAVAFITNGGSNSRLSFKNLQIEKSGAETAYEQFGRTIPISWQTEAGTVYGGKLDVLSGELVVDRAKLHKRIGDMDNTDGAPGWKSAGVKDIIGADFNAQIVGAICSAFPSQFIRANTRTVNDILYLPASGIGKTQTELISSYPDLELDFVIPYATPVTIQLTPNQVNSLLGVNNIFADTGDTEVEYFSQVDEDLTDYIEANLNSYAKKELLNNYVNDVQIDGTSIVENGIAEIPFATSNAGGIVKIDSSFGIKLNDTNKLLINRATASHTKAGTDAARPIVPICQHESVFYGLTKAAGVDMASSSNTVGTYTESAKSAISDMLNGAVQISGTDPTIVAKSGIRYICGEVLSLNFTPSTNGICDVVFTSGSTPTVLTIPDTIRWANDFDPTSLEVNTTYEINVMDGLGVACAWT